MSVVVAKHEPPRPTRSLTPLILIGGVLLGALAFAWSQHLAGSGEVVAARVSMHGIDMSGMTRGEVRSVVSYDARTTLEHEVTIVFPGGRQTFTLGDLGFDYDIDATVANVLSERRTGGPLVQLASWAVTPLIRTKADVAVSRIEKDTGRMLRRSVDELTPTEAVEPVIEVDRQGIIRFSRGVAGRTVNLAELEVEIAAIDPLDPPSTIEAALVTAKPTVTDQAVAGVVEEMTEETSTGVLVGIDGRSVRLSPEQLRRQLVITAADGEITTEFDLGGLQESIEGLFPEPIGSGRKPTFDVVDGDPKLLKAGTPPDICCDPGSAAMVAELILTGALDPLQTVRLEPRSQESAEAIAIADGSLIVQQVSSFTTPHACCEDRVKNIQRMADIVDGFYLLPGESLSLNDYVGVRTEENGFFPAGAIRRGHLIEEVGGGVSQFATTIFNAAYFAGLEFEEYRAHTIYFSRYPYGREATISNPEPDLVIRNVTEFPVLIDTSYTDTSITVSMYSTPNVEVKELDQRVSRRGACTHVETDRQRIFADGRTVVDTVEATYRPAEGIDCSGNRIPQTES